MNFPVSAVIFDMDGVIINSEPYWRQAMIDAFNSVGIHLTEDDCRRTTGLRIGEVVKLWIAHFKTENVSPEDIEKTIMDKLELIIKTQGQAINGVLEVIDYCRAVNIKVGLATSSPQRLVDVVLQRLNIFDRFHSVLSAEKLKYGKPHPEVFINCAELLEVDVNECLVIEDSVNGVIAAKAAKMRVIAATDKENFYVDKFFIADYHCRKMQEVLKIFKTEINFRRI
jgi:mannitol-1-/sugar-/sorbitol-6-/2-deoxyglucose-6-phosphatase